MVEEYLNSELSQFFAEHGILHETTCPQTPQQNGVTERKNMTYLGNYTGSSNWGSCSSCLLGGCSYVFRLSS